MVTPDINFVRHRKIAFRVKPSMREFLNQVGVTISGAALVGALAGYGALIFGRDIPTALALGTVGSVGMAVNTKLKEEESE